MARNFHTNIGGTKGAFGVLFANVLPAIVNQSLAAVCRDDPASS